MPRQTSFGSKRSRSQRSKLPQRPDPGGVFLLNRQTNQEQFLTYNELNEVCNFVMETPEVEAIETFGKPSWRNDPTYNLRRKK